MNHPSIESARAKLDRLESMIDRVFDATPLGERLKEALNRTRGELNEIAHNRGVTAPLVSVIGTKNVGKSWICRSLILDDRLREQIDVGNDVDTEKITWIGPESPEDLDPEAEEYISVESSLLHDLGEPYQLLDVPGLNEGTPQVREAASNLTAATALRVFVTAQQSWKDEDAFAYLKRGISARILPIYVDRDYYTSTEAERGKRADQLLARLDRALCRASTGLKPEILEVVVIPSVDFSPLKEGVNLSAEEVEAEAIGKVRDAFQTLFAGRPVDIAQRVFARLELLRRTLRHELAEFDRHVGGAYRELVEEEHETGQAIIESLLGTEREMQAGIRLRLLLAMPRRAPMLFFPFRSFLSLLAFTAGAIDRMVLAMGGSVVSLAAVALQTFRNAKKLEEMQDRARKAIERRASLLSRMKLREKNEIFLAKVHQQVSSSDGSTRLETGLQIRIAGVEELIEESTGIFDREIERSACSRSVVLGVGAMATAIFLGLGLAPIWAIYRAYLGVWFPAFAGNSTSAWKDFPAPGPEMILTALLVMTAPVFVIAVCLVAFGAKSKRVSRCQKSIGEEHDKLARRLSNLDEDTPSRKLPATLRVVSEDPLREAVSELLDFCGFRQRPSNHR